MKAVGNGVAVNSSLRGKNVTLSAAWKNLAASPEFKFWACLWKDDEPLRIRVVLSPYSETLNLGLVPPLFFSDEEVKECLRRILKHRSCVYSAITETIKSLLKRITLVSDEFFECYSHKIIIPP